MVSATLHFQVSLKVEALATADSSTYAAQTVTTSGAKRLAVSFEAIGDNPSLGNFAGATGGDLGIDTIRQLV